MPGQLRALGVTDREAGVLWLAAQSLSDKKMAEAPAMVRARSPHDRAWTRGQVQARLVW